MSDAHLSHIFEVVVSLLQGPGSVQGLAHAGVLAEEGLAVVLDPVYHLDESKKRSARLKNLHRRLKLILLIPAACIFFIYLFIYIFFTGQRYKTSQGS